MTDKNLEKLENLQITNYNCEDMLDGEYYADPKEIDEDIILINAQYNKTLQELRTLDKMLDKLTNLG